MLHNVIRLMVLALIFPLINDCRLLSLLLLLPTGQNLLTATSEKETATYLSTVSFIVLFEYVLMPKMAEDDYGSLFAGTFWNVVSIINWIVGAVARRKIATRGEGYV